MISKASYTLENAAEKAGLIRAQAMPFACSPEGQATWQIGKIWKEGATPANYNISMGFESEGPVKVKGGVQQTPTSALKGSPRPPFKHDLDVFSRNAANGWWEASCAPDCVGTGGSTNFQGSVVEALWEFPQSRSVMVSDFPMVGWMKTFCANPFEGLPSRLEPGLPARLYRTRQEYPRTHSSPACLGPEDRHRSRAS